MILKDMLGRSGVVARDDALRILNEHLTLPELKAERVHISEALGRILSEDVSSSVDLPEFNRSTMDGYAVRSADTFGATEALPAFINIVGEIPMGAVSGRGISKGEAMRIATGGAVPEGADAVVMLEHAQQVDAGSIEVVKPVAPLENVIQAGEDIRKGETILAKGHMIRPQDMAALAGVGITRVNVYRKPRVAIISTGNEIVPADHAPAPGQVRDMNSYNLEGMIAEMGGIPVRKGIISDDYEKLRGAASEALRDCGLIIMTGGSSVGTSDLTAKVINDLGPPGVLVHGVSIKPGKPLIVGIIGNNIPVFGLPGHPAAVSVCFEVFVKPALTRLTGNRPDPALEGLSPHRAVKAILGRSISSSPGREDYVRVALEKREDGLWAKPIFGASGLINTLVRAVGTVVVPKNAIGIEAGEEVEVRLF